MRRPLTAADQRYISEGKTGRLLQPAQRDLLNERENVAFECGEVDELAVLFVPLACLALASDVRAGASNCCGRSVGRVGVVSMRTILEVMAFSLLGCVVVSPDAAGKGD
jgi:hypothetical protein